MKLTLLKTPDTTAIVKNAVAFAGTEAYATLLFEPIGHGGDMLSVSACTPGVRLFRGSIDCEAVQGATGRVAVSAREFGRVWGSLSAHVTLETKENRLLLTDEHGRQALPVLAAEWKLKDHEEHYTSTEQHEFMAADVARAARAVLAHPDIKELGGAAIIDGVLTCASGPVCPIWGMSEEQGGPSLPVEECKHTEIPIRSLVPVDALKFLATIGDEETVELEWNAISVTIEVAATDTTGKRLSWVCRRQAMLDPRSIFAKATEGYPKALIILDRADLLRQCKRAVGMMDGAKAMRFRLGEEDFSLEFASPKGTVVAGIATSMRYTLEKKDKLPILFGLNPDYLARILGAVPGERVALEYWGKGKPIVVYQAGNHDKGKTYIMGMTI